MFIVKFLLTFIFLFQLSSFADDGSYQYSYSTNDPEQAATAFLFYGGLYLLFNDYPTKETFKQYENSQKTDDLPTKFLYTDIASK